MEEKIKNLNHSTAPRLSWAEKKRNKMNWKTIITIALLLPLLWTACKNSGSEHENQAWWESAPVETAIHHNAYPLTLEKEKEYHFDIVSRGTPIFGKTDDPDYLYTYILKNLDGKCEIQKFTTGLELTETFFIGEGHGPGEAINPRIYGGDEKSVMVYDIAGMKYIRYDAGFNLLSEYKELHDKGYFLYCGFSYDPARDLLVSGVFNFSDRHDGLEILYLVQFTDALNPQYTRIFEIPQFMRTKSDRQYNQAKALHFGIYFGHIYVLDKRDYRLLKMDMTGKILVDKKIKFEPVSLPKALRKRWIKKWSPNNRFSIERADFPEELYPAVWLTPLGDGLAVGRAPDYDRDNKGPVTADYFDADLNYLGKIALPYFELWNHPGSGGMRLEHILYSKGGWVYFSDDRGDEDYWLVRYRLRR